MTGLGSSCGACKFLRRKCSIECVFAPYFCYDEAATHFAAVHKVFGASNVSKLLLHLPVHNRNDAAITISYEALARMQDPVQGCVAYIFALQQQVATLQQEIEILGNQMAIDNFEKSLETTPVTTCEAQAFAYQDPMNMQFCQNQSPAQQNHAGYNQGFDCQTNTHDVLYGWEQLNPFESQPNNLEKLLEGFDEETLANFSQLDSVNNWGVPLWY